MRSDNSLERSRNDAVHVRQAVEGDTLRVAGLSTHLGYQASAADMCNRIGRLLSSPTHALYVAVTNTSIVGWIAGELRLSLETGPRAEITGLVVDASCRRLGTGRILVAALEGWTLRNEVHVMLVRSNVTRPEAHPFYECLGYQQVKTQHSYRKVLGLREHSP